MASRKHTPPQVDPDADERVLVRLADASIYDEWCTPLGVFTRQGPPISLTRADAKQLLASAGQNLVEADTWR